MAACFERPIAIETERCILGEMKEADIDYWYQFMNNHQINRYYPAEETPPTQEDINGVLRRLERNSLDPDRAVKITLSITLKSQKDMPIWWVSYGPLPEDESLKEIGFALDLSQWGKGIATEAAKAFLHWTFSKVSTDRLFATVNRRNLASVRVLEKIDMTSHENEVTSKIKLLSNHILYSITREMVGEQRKSP